MNQFKVKIGRHIEPLGGREKKIYKAGDIVRSDKDLCALFVEKFDNLGPVSEETLPAVTVAVTAPLVPVEVAQVATGSTIAPLVSHVEETEVDPPTKPARKVKTKKGPGDWDND